MRSHSNDPPPDQIPLRRLNLNLLYALDAILNARSLTEAGKRVLLTQPAMSLSLRKLRDQFQDELVAYVGGERVLTPLAVALRPQVRRLLKELDDTFHFQLDFQPATTRRTLSLAAPEALEIMLLGRVIPKLLREAPHIDIRIIPFDHGNPARVFEQGADMIVVPERFSDPRFPSQELMHDELFCMVWEDHPFIGEKLTPDGFLRARHVAIFDPLSPSSHLDAEARALLDRRRIAVRTSLHAALPGLIMGTDLLVTASGWLLQHYASMMPLRVVHPPFAAPAEPVIAQWPQHIEGDPGHLWLLGHIRAATQHLLNL